MVTADRRLVRAYRRLIRFYPPGPRRDELLDTLIECAPAGRRRPAVSTIANLIWHGTRARLGRPRSTGIVVLALFIALAAGFVGASAASRLGLEAVGSLPVGAEAAEINDTVFPGLTVWGGGDADKIVTQGDGDGVEYGYAISWVKSTPATRNVAGYTAATRARLETAGWTITSVDPPLDETDMVGANPADRAEGFTAERDALTLHFDDYLYPGAPWYDGDGNATYSIWHRQPWWLTGLAWLGGLLAAALAWLLTGWMSRRVRSAGGAGLGVTGAVCCLIGVLPAALLALPGAGGGADETVSPYWQGLVYLGAGPAVLAGIVAALMVVVVFLAKPPALLARGFRHAATWPGRVRRRPRVLAALLAGATIMAGLSLYRVDTRHLAAGSCTPVVPSGVVDPSSAHLSYRSRIFIDPATPAEERNLIEAAFGRSFGGGYTFSGSPTAGFTDAFCSHGRLAGASEKRCRGTGTSTWPAPACSREWPTRSRTCPASSPSSTCRPTPSRTHFRTHAAGRTPGTARQLAAGPAPTDHRSAAPAPHRRLTAHVWMTSMIRRRAFAVVLLVIAFLTLAATRAFPFLGDVSGLTETAIVFAGVACGLAGVWLWTRKTPEPES